MFSVHVIVREHQIPFSFTSVNHYLALWGRLSSRRDKLTFFLISAKETQNSVDFDFTYKCSTFLSNKEK